MSSKQWYVYLIRCKDGSLYCGCTNDLERRLSQHNNGTGSKYVRSRRPAHYVYFEEADNRSAASKREYAIKRMSKLDKEYLVSKFHIDTLIKTNLTVVVDLLGK